MLLATGFQHIDAVSFASAATAEEAEDPESVLSYLDPPDDVEMIGLVLNEEGAERALATSAVSTVAFPYSISPTFLGRHQNQTPEEALDALEAIGTVAYKAGLEVVAYIPMAFGNPFGDAWDIGEVVSACDLLVDSGVTQIALEDTSGQATAAEIAHVTGTVLGIHDTIEIGLHLHTRPEHAAAKVRAGYEAGCRRFDSVLGGHGTCPYAQDLLVANLATETLIAELARLGADLPPLRPLETLITASKGIAAKFGGSVLPM